MTRKSKREIQRALEDMGVDDETPARVRFNRQRVDATGEVVETASEEVLEIGGDGKEFEFTETVVETGWSEDQ